MSRQTLSTTLTQHDWTHFKRGVQSTSDTWAVVCSLKPSLLQIQAGLFEIKLFLSEATQPQSSARPTCLHGTPVVPGRDRGVRCSPLRPPQQEASTVWIHIVRLILQSHPTTTATTQNKKKRKKNKTKISSDHLHEEEEISACGGREDARQGALPSSSSGFHLETFPGEEAPRTGFHVSEARSGRRRRRRVSSSTAGIHGVNAHTHAHTHSSA